MTAIPHDPALEASLVGACLTRPDLLGGCLETVDSGDFYLPQYRDAWAAMTGLHAKGEIPDAALVANANPERDRRAFGLELVEAMSRCPTPSNAESYARAIVELSTLRRAQGACAEAFELVKAGAADVPATLDALKALFADIERPGTDRPLDGLVTFDALADTPEQTYEWLVPGVLERLERVLLVGPEGYGKSMLYRQFAVMCGQGIHPFTLESMPAVRTLLVDLENPPRIVQRTTQAIVVRARTIAGYEPDRAWLWSQPGGIDLRSRTGVAQLSKILARTRPDLVCLGPLYKAFHKRERESDEGVAGEVQTVLDDLRTRFDFALLLEHHAPKAQAGKRDMVPFGSSLWQRWPEFGPALTPAEPGKRDTLLWGEWRGPRDVRQWPSKLVRGTDWPWQAIYEEKR